MSENATEDQHYESLDEQTPLTGAVKKPLLNAIERALIFLILASLSGTATASANTDLQYYFICRSNGIAKDVCFTSPIATELESIVSGYGSIIGAMLTLTITPTISQLGRKYGEKSLLLGGAFVAFLRHLVLLYLGFHSKGSYLWLLVPQVMAYCSILAISRILIVQYVCDRSESPVLRAKYLSWSGGSIAVSAIIGPFFGSRVVSGFDLQMLYVMAITLDLFAVISGFYLIDGTRVKQEVEESAPTSLWESVKTLGCSHIEDKDQRRQGIAVLVIMILLEIQTICPSIVAPMDVKLRFGWGTVENSLMLSVAGAAGLVGFTVLYPLLYAKLGSWFTIRGDRCDRVDGLCLTSMMLIEAAANAFMGAASDSRDYTMARLFQLLIFIPGPGADTLTVKYAPPGGSGKLIAGMSVIGSAAALVVPSLCLALYRHLMLSSVSSYFYMLSVTAVILGVVTLWVVRPLRDTGARTA